MTEFNPNLSKGDHADYLCVAVEDGLGTTLALEGRAPHKSLLLPNRLLFGGDAHHIPRRS